MVHVRSSCKRSTSIARCTGRIEQLCGLMIRSSHIFLSTSLCLEWWRRSQLAGHGRVDIGLVACVGIPPMAIFAGPTTPCGILCLGITLALCCSEVDPRLRHRRSLWIPYGKRGTAVCLFAIVGTRTCGVAFCLLSNAVLWNLNGRVKIAL